MSIVGGNEDPLHNPDRTYEAWKYNPEILVQASGMKINSLSTSDKIYLTIYLPFMSLIVFCIKLNHLTFLLLFDINYSRSKSHLLITLPEKLSSMTSDKNQTARSTAYPCKRESCAIQACLVKNDFKENFCVEELQNLKKCCFALFRRGELSEACGYARKFFDALPASEKQLLNMEG